MKRSLLMQWAIAGFAVWMYGCGCSDDQQLKTAGFESVTIGGELSERLNRNFDRMETELYQPEQVYWTEEESGGWPADKEGRTILALVLDARASHRAPKYLDELITLLPEHLNAKGYLGSIHEGQVDEQQLSGHGWLLRGLCEYYAWKQDPKVLDMAKTIVDSLFLPIAPFVDRYPLSNEERIAGTGEMSGSIQNTVNGWRLSSDIGCVFIGMEGLIHSYQYIPSAESKALIEQLIGLFRRMDLVGIKAQTHASLTAMRGMLRYASLTGDTTLVPEVESRWQLYKEYGMTENNENYNWFERYDTWTEPCAIIDSYLVAVQLWAATRNPAYLEDAEKIYFNGIAATQRANGGFGCDRPVGVIFPDIAIHADEAHWCCTMRGGEGLGRAAEYAYFTAGDTVFVPAYHESTLALADRGLTVEQHTEYPFGNRIEFVVKEAPKREMTLALFVPSDMRIESMVASRPEFGTISGPQNGFVTATGRFAAGDTLTLTYGFDARWVRLENKDITDSTRYKAMYGPLVLGYEAETPLEFMGEVEIVPASDGRSCAVRGAKECRPVAAGKSGKNSFKRDGATFEIVEGTEHRFTPLYHLLDPAVSSGANYHRMVTVKKHPLVE
ncbi:MAG TPA: glycoside hydrolase family 127 protein [Candidatus Alistipes merdigallinarum]|nr:glycoside hydrolase family 127 protein [Candidatus Alistipes merdigallinarum]